MDKLTGLCLNTDMWIGGNSRCICRFLSSTPVNHRKK